MARYRTDVRNSIRRRVLYPSAIPNSTFQFWKSFTGAAITAKIARSGTRMHWTSVTRNHGCLHCGCVVPIDVIVFSNVAFLRQWNGTTRTIYQTKLWIAKPQTLNVITDTNFTTCQLSHNDNDVSWNLILLRHANICVQIFIFLLLSFFLFHVVGHPNR